MSETARANDGRPVTAARVNQDSSAGQPGRASPPSAEAAGQTPLLVIEGVCRHFGGLQAVHDFSLTIPEGYIYSLIGPNGAGKTTVINLISGFCTPSSGRIRLAGREISTLSPHRRAHLGIGRTFQNLQLFGRMSVRGNIAAGLYRRTRSGFLSGMLGVPAVGREERFVAVETGRWLTFMGLADVAEQTASALPYGLQKRLEIGRALAAAPRLLLLDEPAAGLNAPEKAGMAELIIRIRDEGVTLLIVEHDMELVMGLSDRVAVLDYGRLIASGPPAAIQQDPRVVEAYLGRELHPC